MRATGSFAIALIIVLSLLGLWDLWSFDTNALRCTRDNSELATIEAVNREPARFSGHCIRVSGLLSNRAVTANLETLYRADQGSQFEHLGVYPARDDQLVPEVWRRRSFGEFVGLATTCNALARIRVFRAFTGGPCHYETNAILIVSHSYWYTAPPARFTGEAARASYGDLRALLPDAPEVKSVHRNASAWFDAIRRGDLNALAAVNSEWAERPQYVLTSSGFRSLIGKRAAPITYFRGSGEDPFASGIWACVCRESDCSNTWPISWIDTDTDDPWPYLCVSFRDDGKIWFH